MSLPGVSGTVVVGFVDDAAVALAASLLAGVVFDTSCEVCG